jgi:hypothetical protein
LPAGYKPVTISWKHLDCCTFCYLEEEESTFLFLKKSPWVLSALRGLKVVTKALGWGNYQNKGTARDGNPPSSKSLTNHKAPLEMQSRKKQQEGTLRFVQHFKTEGSSLKM